MLELLLMLKVLHKSIHKEEEQCVILERTLSEAKDTQVYILEWTLPEELALTCCTRTHFLRHNE